MPTDICTSLKSYFKSVDGATAIEYGLIAVGISLGISTSVYLFGDAISTLLYDDLPKALTKP